MVKIYFVHIGIISLRVRDPHIRVFYALLNWSESVFVLLRLVISNCACCCEIFIKFLQETFELEFNPTNETTCHLKFSLLK